MRFAQPTPAWLGFGLACVVIANTGFEFGAVFNNAMLPDIVEPECLGSLSGWAWALGYSGGLAALGLALVAFIRPEQPPLGLDRNLVEHVRIVGPLAALWLALFSLPLFFFTPDRPSSGAGIGQAVRCGLRELRESFAELGNNRSLAMFLLAHMIYADGLFALGGVYAAGVFGFSLGEVVTFGIVLNMAAGVGAFAFAWLDDRIGSKPTIIAALTGLIGASILA